MSVATEITIARVVAQKENNVGLIVGVGKATKKMKRMDRKAVVLLMIIALASVEQVIRIVSLRF